MFSAESSVSRRRRRAEHIDTEIETRFSFFCISALDAEETEPDMSPSSDVYGGPSHSFITQRPASPDFSIIDSPGTISEHESTNNPRLSTLSFPSFGSTRIRHSYDEYSPTSEKNALKSLLPRLWDAFSSPGRLSAIERARVLSYPRKGKGKFSRSSSYDDDFDYSINYMDLPPLDGDEGELIDDEACFIDTIRVTGIDIIKLLPPEISLYIFSRFLELSSLVACLAVSKTWRVYASDNSVWHTLFMSNWEVNLNRRPEEVRPFLRHSYPDFKRWSGLDDMRLPSYSSSKVFSSPRAPMLSHSLTFPRVRQDMIAPSFAPPSSPLPPGVLDWQTMYRARLELDDRWGVSNRPNARPFEPEQTRLTGHRDSVYCAEFDSSRIITGSRDQTIRVWSLRTGLLLSTFTGHEGSVLCLKFEKDWDLASPDARGLMVSGSSDKTVRVWEIWSERNSLGEFEIMSKVRAVLTGHTGGVLDLKINESWIVSCSKDTSIRVWDRKTLQLHRVLNGHEGPVNAVGLQGDQVVSASGDGKMILWDVVTGKQLRVFQGHDRGLACVDFNSDYIISGSNDCTIKIWRASTGECLRTLIGHEALVRALAFDPHSGRLVSASYDKSIKVWDWRKGRMIREFALHTSYVFDVKFDKDKIISTSHDRKIVVLDFTQPGNLDTSLFV